jgi:serine protease inhibitor
MLVTAVYPTRWQELRHGRSGGGVHAAGRTKVESRACAASPPRGAWAGADWQAAELPYDDERLDFLIVVPRGNFLAFQAGWTAAACQAIRDSLRVQACFVMMPPFDLARNQPSRPALEASGLEHLFNATADLRGSVPNAPPVSTKCANGCG